MKYFFHIIITGALLLGSLIIFNARDNECTTQLTDNPDTEPIELLAELCSKRTNISSPYSFRHNPLAEHESVSGKLNRPGCLDFKEHQLRVKTQMLIYLELKPSIGFQSSMNIHQLSGNDDPPIA